MKIQDKDIYYGAVLNQLVESNAFTIRKVEDKNGLYIVNGNQMLLIKYSTQKTSDSKWRFSFRKDDINLPNPTDHPTYYDYKVFFALVCGNETICLLTEQQVKDLVDPDEQATHTIWVTCHSRCNMRVTGTLNLKKPILVTHNAFPNNMLREDNKSYSTWPALCKTINLYNNPPNLFCSLDDLLFDLPVYIDQSNKMVNGEAVIYLGISTWKKTWDEKDLKAMEDYIKRHLASYEFSVKITQHTKNKDNPEHQQEFVWKLCITNNDEDE